MALGPDHDRAFPIFQVWRKLDDEKKANYYNDGSLHGVLLFHGRSCRTRFRRTYVVGANIIDGQSNGRCERWVV